MESGENEYLIDKKAIYEFVLSATDLNRKLALSLKECGFQ
jgi:hypothetical protein